MGVDGVQTGSAVSLQGRGDVAWSQNMRSLREARRIVNQSNPKTAAAVIAATGLRRELGRTINIAEKHGTYFKTTDWAKAEGIINMFLNELGHPALSDMT